MKRLASDIVKTAVDTVLGVYGKVYYRRDNNTVSYGYQYNVGQWYGDHWCFDCLGFVHGMVNGFSGNRGLTGGGATLDEFVLMSDEDTTLKKYCSTRGTFPKKGLKPGSLVKMSGHVGLYVGERYIESIKQTVNVAEVTMSMGGGGKLSWIDLNTGIRYTCKGGAYLGAWTNWGEFDRVWYDGDTAKEEIPVAADVPHYDTGDLAVAMIRGYIKDRKIGNEPERSDNLRSWGYTDAEIKEAQKKVDEIYRRYEKDMECCRLAMQLIGGSYGDGACARAQAVRDEYGDVSYFTDAQNKVNAYIEE